MPWFSWDKAFYAMMICLIVGLLSACSAPDGNVEDGKRWYTMHNCDSCHGLHGNDGRSPDITNLNWSFRKFVKRLRKAGDMTMPEYTEADLPQEDAADIFAYINSL